MPYNIIIYKIKSALWTIIEDEETIFIYYVKIAGPFISFQDICLW